MRKLLKILSFKNLIEQFPKQNYSVYRHIRNNIAPATKTSSSSRIYYCSFSTLTSEDVAENSFAEQNKEFYNPKSILFQVLNEAFLRDQSLDLKPSIITEQIKSDSANGYTWKAKLQMKWPEAFEIESSANRKTDALNICFLQACQKLKQMGVLDSTNKPLLPKRKLSEDEIKTAKSDLLNLFQHLWHRLGNKECMPKFNSILLQGIYGNYWQTELHLSYPEKIVFKAVSLRSTNAESIAAYEALMWLTDKGIINKKRRLVQYSKTDEMKLKENYQAPYSISIPPMLQQKMQAALTDIEKQKSFLSFEDSTRHMDPKEDTSKEIEIRDLITDYPYYKLTDQQLSDRSRYLYERNKNDDKRCLQMSADDVKTKSLLPILQKREEILKLINENQVVILSGDTGCGKSTQVPQFILDQYIKNMKGAECNIIVTQPRRISAFSLAERVAFERGEKIGNSVGFQIRLNKCLPERNGAILYCTTGMLLRKILANPNFEGISHVIIDEIHERNIQIDLICILLKNVLKNNKDLKVLLMSATFNTNLFAQYFDFSAIIHVPGKMHTVEEYFLEDLVNKIPTIKNIDFKKPSLDVDLIVDTINHIHENEPPGAILCFLPGWTDIRAVHNKLLENEASSKRFLIFPMHSRLPHHEQKKIFIKPPEGGERKIILGTNIAETSITIDDVVYVVNSGLHKGTRLDTQAGIASLSTKWITKANVRQRKGRAGRVKPGKCYHLFSWKTFMKMEEYPVAEILRMPLESVILDCKLYCPEMKAEEFLSKGLQPPATSAIQIGIKELQMLGVLDEKESLTRLGKIIVNFSTHPRLSVALAYAAFLRCLDPVLTICALMTVEKEPFADTLDDKLHMRNIKNLHDNGLCSDHLALMKIYNTWNSLAEKWTFLPGEINASQFCEKNLLDEQMLSRIKELKELFAEELHVAGLIRDLSSYNDYSNQLNLYSSCVPCILAVLTAAFSPNVIKVFQGEISNGKLNKNNLVYSIIKGQNAYIQKESVVSDTEELPTPWLIFFSALNSEARRKALISAVSTVPGICLLLHAGRNIAMSHMKKENSNQENLALLTIDNYNRLSFSCTDREARLLLDWRECLFEIFNLYIKNLKENCAEREHMISCCNKFVPVLKEILELPQVPFTKGQTYEFVDNELIAKDLWSNVSE